MLVTQVGMYGVERDEDKEDEVDCVWVGNTINYASKYSDIAMSGEIFISENVYKNLSNCDESVWCEVYKYKGSKQFNGYVATDYYLEFAEELGKPTTNEKDNAASVETSNILVEGIKEIERLQNKLIEKEKELVLLEEQLKREN